VVGVRGGAACWTRALAGCVVVSRAPTRGVRWDKVASGVVVKEVYGAVEVRACENKSSSRRDAPMVSAPNVLSMSSALSSVGQ